MKIVVPRHIVSGSTVGAFAIPNYFLFSTDITGDGANAGRGLSHTLVRVFSRCLCTAQESTRNICGGERAAVSLRDVSRCIKVQQRRPVGHTLQRLFLSSA